MYDERNFSPDNFKNIRGSMDAYLLCMREFKRITEDDKFLMYKAPIDQIKYLICIMETARDYSYNWVTYQRANSIIHTLWASLHEGIGCSDELYCSECVHEFSGGKKQKDVPNQDSDERTFEGLIKEYDAVVSRPQCMEFLLDKTLRYLWNILQSAYYYGKRHADQNDYTTRRNILDAVIHARGLCGENMRCRECSNNYNGDDYECEEGYNEKTDEQKYPTKSNDDKNEINPWRQADYCHHCGDPTVACFCSGNESLVTQTATSIRKEIPKEYLVTTNNDEDSIPELYCGECNNPDDECICVNEEKQGDSGDNDEVASNYAGDADENENSDLSSVHSNSSGGFEKIAMPMDEVVGRPNNVDDSVSKLDERYTAVILDEKHLDEFDKLVMHLRKMGENATNFASVLAYVKDDVKYLLKTTKVILIPVPIVIDTMLTMINNCQYEDLRKEFKRHLLTYEDQSSYHHDKNGDKAPVTYMSVFNRYYIYQNKIPMFIADILTSYIGSDYNLAIYQAEINKV